MAVSKSEPRRPAPVGIPRLSALRNFTPIMGAEIGAKLMALVATVHVAREAGPSVLGIALLTMTIVGFLSVGVLRGIETQAYRALSQHPDSVGALIRRTLGLRLLAAAGLSVILLLTATLVTSPSMSAPLAAGCVVLLARAVSMRWVYEALQNQLRVSWGRLVSQALVVGLILAFVHAGTPPAVVVLFWAVGELALAVILLPPLVPSIVDRVPTIGVGLRTVVVTSTKFGLALLLLQGLIAADLLLIGLLKGAREAGEYGAAYRVVEGAWVVSNALGAAFLPRIAAAANGPRLVVVLSAFWRLTALVAVPLGVMGFVLGDEIIMVLYGGQYHAAEWPLSLLLVATAFDFANMAFAFSLGMVGRENRMLLIFGSGFLLNIALNLVLIPSWGPTGAATAMLVSECVICLIAVTSFLGTLRLRQLLRPLVDPLRLCIPAVLAALLLEAAGVSALAVLCGAGFALIAACAVQLGLIKRTLTEANAA